MRPRREVQGFTLIELLIALAIVGILAALGFSNFVSATRNAQLQEATAQFAADLQRARSTAQRYNQDASLTVNGGSDYTLVLDGRVTARQLPRGTEVDVEIGGNNVTYSAPYGEIRGAVNRRFVITSAHTGKERVVKVIGVTGKVIVSDR